MDEKIREALREAYVGEAKAALRLSMFADKAEQEGYPQIARLFRVIAFSEEIHGKRALRVLKEIKTTEENLAESFESEKTVAEIAYDRFVKMAEQAGDKQALLHFSQSRRRGDTPSSTSSHEPLHGRAPNRLSCLQRSAATYGGRRIAGEMSVCAAKKTSYDF